MAAVAAGWSPPAVTAPARPARAGPAPGPERLPSSPHNKLAAAQPSKASGRSTRCKTRAARHVAHVLAVACHGVPRHAEECEQPVAARQRAHGAAESCERAGARARRGRTCGKGQRPPTSWRKAARRRARPRCSRVCVASTSARQPSSVATTATLPPPTGAGSGAHARSTTRPSAALAATVTAPCAPQQASALPHPFPTYSFNLQRSPIFRSCRQRAGVLWCGGSPRCCRPPAHAQASSPDSAGNRAAWHFLDTGMRTPCGATFRIQ